MPAGGKELVLHVEGAEAGLLHEQVLLGQAEAADVQAGAVGGGPGNEGPAELVPPFKPLQIPHVLAQARVSPLPDVLEAGSVVVSAGLPVGFRPPKVGLHLQEPGVHHHLVLQLRPLGRQGLDLGLVDDILSQALASQWAGRLVLLRAAAFISTAAQ